MPATLKLVHLEENEPVTTSLVIAERTGNEHKSVIRILNTHKARFERAGILRFEIGKLTKGKGRPTKYAILNRVESLAENLGITRIPDVEFKAIEAS